ncbi:hypothetical protein DVH24_037035 [Malus domestica]|uniref:Uncharacterized protein n=1 Tax=Malus domestica TaxID=3750 RepID=A0A498HJD5_MALDO|nr:hypothetical protein DVH24_037035 [Malus domestica]
MQNDVTLSLPFTFHQHRQKRAKVQVTNVETISHPWDFVDTPCDYTSYCGGCKTQNLIYEAQVKAKEHQVHQLIINFGKFSHTKLEFLSIMKPIRKHAFAIMLSSCFLSHQKTIA